MTIAAELVRGSRGPRENDARADTRANVQAQMAAGRGPFSTFKPAEESEVRTEKAEMNPRLKKIARAWEKAVAFERVWEEAIKSQNYLHCSVYSGFAKAVRGIHISDREMDNVIAFLSQFQYIEEFPRMAGLFLSALVNTGKDNEYTIRTRLLSVRLNYLGHRNKKKVIVDGDVGDYCGYTYAGSSFLVKGDAGHSFGNSAPGGLLSVEGNAEASVGFDLNGATIIIQGNTDGGLGFNMRRGVIRVGGTIGPLLGIGSGGSGGKIYQGEKLIWSKGRSE